MSIKNVFQVISDLIDLYSFFFIYEAIEKSLFSNISYNQDINIHITYFTK